MLSDINASILTSLQNAGGVVFSDALPPEITPLRIEQLMHCGYIHRAVHPSGIAVYQLLPAGEDALSAFAQREEQRSADEADKRREKNLQDERWRKDARRSWVQWAVTTILAIATFFAGAMLEANTGFIEWVSSLLH